METFLVRHREIVEQAHTDALAEDDHRDEVNREVAEIHAEQQQVADRRRALDYLESKQAADRLTQRARTPGQTTTQGLPGPSLSSAPRAARALCVACSVQDENKPEHTNPMSDQSEGQ